MAITIYSGIADWLIKISVVFQNQKGEILFNVFHKNIFQFSLSYRDNWTQTRRDTGTSMSRTGVPELQMKIKRSFL